MEPSQAYQPATPAAQGQVYTDERWATCPDLDRIVLEDSRGEVYRSCISSGVIVPTVPLSLSELANLLFPGEWSLLGGQ